MKTRLARFATDESGATAMEYGLVAAGIAVAMITSVNQLGCQVANMFDNVASNIPSSELAAPRQPRLTPPLRLPLRVPQNSDARSCRKCSKTFSS